MLEMMNLGLSGEKPPFNLKKFGLTARESIYVLSDNGNLYSISPTNEGLSGVGTTTNSWTLISSGVDDFWAGHATLLFKTRSGQWFITGYNFFFPRTENLPVEVTDKVTAINKPIKKIEMGAGAIAFLYTDNTLAMAGQGPHLGQGYNSAFPDLVYVSPPTALGITDVAIDDNANTTWILSGDAYGCGVGTNYQFSSTNGTGQRTSFVRIPNPVNSGILGLKAGNLCIYMRGSRTDGDEVILGLGNNTGGKLAQASTVANVSTVSIITASVYTPSYGFYPLYIGVVRRRESNIALTGQAAGTGWGLASQNYYDFTRVPGTDPLWGEVFQRGSSLNTYILTTDNVLYGSGNASTGKLPGYTTAQTTYVPIDLSGLE